MIINIGYEACYLPLKLYVLGNAMIVFQTASRFNYLFHVFLRNVSVCMRTCVRACVHARFVFYITYYAYTGVVINGNVLIGMI